VVVSVIDNELAGFEFHLDTLVSADRWADLAAVVFERR
jgi:hypothetical protein